MLADLHVRAERIQEFALGGGASSLPSPFLPSPSLPLQLGSPLNQLGGLGKRSKLPAENEFGAL